MKKRNKIIKFICLFALIVGVSFAYIKEASCSIYYRDDGYIELYGEDISELSEEEYEKVIQITFKNELPDDEDLKLLSKLSNIEQLSFQAITLDDVTFINSIDSNNIKLYFISTNVNFDGLKNDNITLISVANSRMTNFSQIENITTLESISVGDTYGYEKIDYSNFPNLTSLVLCTYIDDFEELISQIPNVTSLSLAGSNIQNKDTAYLKQLTNLTYLNLNQTYLTDIDFVTSFPNLEELILPWAVVDLSPIYDLTNLTYLKWEAYTELFVTQDLVDYLDANGVSHLDYNPDISDEINDILTSLDLTSDTDAKEALEKISEYIINNIDANESYSSYVEGNPSSLDIIISQKMGVCYHHSIAVYTLSKVLGIDDVYGVEGTLMINVGILDGNEANEGDEYNPSTFLGHAWNIVNYNGVWYGIDTAQMEHDSTDVAYEVMFAANFFKNPLVDDDYDYNYAMENYYDFNYYFALRHVENDGILTQTQTFEFSDIDGLDIKNHVIYDYDVTDSEAVNLCSKVLDNYDCEYTDTDNSGTITTGDKVVISKNNITVDTFTLSTTSYVEPVATHLGAISFSYVNYPDEEVNGMASTLYFNEDNPLNVSVKGENYDENTSYSANIKIVRVSDNEEIYSTNSQLTGKEINDGVKFEITSDILNASESCESWWCAPHYYVYVDIDGTERSSAIWYYEAEKTTYNITVNSDNNVTFDENSVFVVEENGTLEYTINVNLGYIITSIKINDVEYIDSYVDNKITIENITEDMEIVVESTAEMYEFIEGNDATYNEENMVFKVNGPLELFETLYVNGEVLNSKYYTLASGSTIITLSSDYLDTLESGTYTLTAKYGNGTSTFTTFVIEDDSESNTENLSNNATSSKNNPYTYDGILKYVVLGVISLMGITGLVIYKRKFNN